MITTSEKRKNSPLKKWLIILGVFILVQCIFLLIDGTGFEPNLNNIGEYTSEAVKDKLTWFTLYDQPLFKFVTLLFIVAIILSAVKDIVTYFIRK